MALGYRSPWMSSAERVGITLAIPCRTPGDCVRPPSLGFFSSSFFFSSASRIPPKRSPPHADTRSGIDASWLVCRRADYAPRLRSSPRLAQNALVYYYFSSFLLSCQLPCCNSLWAFSAISRLRLLRDELSHIGVEILLGGDKRSDAVEWELHITGDRAVVFCITVPARSHPLSSERRVTWRSALLHVGAIPFTPYSSARSGRAIQSPKCFGGSRPCCWDTDDGSQNICDDAMDHASPAWPRGGRVSA